MYKAIEVKYANNTYLFLCFNFKHNFLKITFKFIENKTIIDTSIHILCINKLIFK